MTEDVAGTLEGATGSHYSTCSQCGTVFRRDAAYVEPTGLNDDAHSEFQELCPECRKLELEGELPLVGDVQ
jgi:hypothetical protein